MRYKSMMKNRVLNFLVGLYKPFSIRTFFHTINYLELSAIQKSAVFLEKHLDGAALFDNKKGGYWQFCVDKVKQNQWQGLWLEFGVRDGVSAKFFSQHSIELSSDNVMYGFDAFEGIRNSWSSINEPIGSFSRDGNLPPKVAGLEIILGWVEDTLEPFLESHKEKIAFIHFDLDVYNPTKYALSVLKNRLRPGTVILFDEFHGYPGWEHNEKRALEEVLGASEYKFIAFSRKQAAIQIV